MSERMSMFVGRTAQLNAIHSVLGTPGIRNIWK